MAMGDVQGQQQLFDNLDRVPRNLQRKTLRRGMYRGAALVRDEARRLVRRRTGKLAKQIRVVSSRGSRQRGVVAYRVGLTPKGFYGKFLENGHVARGPGGKIKGGEMRRKAARVVLRAEGRFVPPYPFMRPAAERLPQAMAEVNRTVEQAIASGEVIR